MSREDQPEDGDLREALQADREEERVARDAGRWAKRPRPEDFRYAAAEEPGAPGAESTTNRSLAAALAQSVDEVRALRRALKASQAVVIEQREDRDALAHRIIALERERDELREGKRCDALALGLLTESIGEDCRKSGDDTEEAQQHRAEAMLLLGSITLAINENHGSAPIPRQVLGLVLKALGALR